MTLTEEMLARLVPEIAGGTATRWGDASIDWKPPFRRVTMRRAVLEATAKDPRGPVREEELATADALLGGARGVGGGEAERVRGGEGEGLDGRLVAGGGEGSFWPSCSRPWPSGASFSRLF